MKQRILMIDNYDSFTYNLVQYLGEMGQELLVCRNDIGFTGNLDTCITIRTILVKDSKAYVQAGAGIVADSQPAKEWAETRSKAAGMLEAIRLAEAGLV